MYKELRKNENDDSGITGNSNSLSTLTTKVNSQGGTLAGSSAMRFTNVATTPQTIPAAGVAYYDSTLKVIVVSDATSFHTAGGSLAS